MNELENPKAVIYCRVSDTSQNSDDAHGLQSQDARLREYAQRRGYTVVASFHDDISGKYAKRPALTAMLDMIARRKKTHIVLVDDTTRLARSPRAHLAVRDAIASVALRLESPTKVYVDDPEEDPFEMMEAVFSGAQRRQNAIQTKNRMRGRILAGVWPLRAPVGYAKAKVEGQGKVLVRNEPVASVVAEALEGYASGRFQTQTEILRWLQTQPRFPEKLKRNLKRERIREMLSRPLYAGMLRMEQWDVALMKGSHEPLISYETYQRIQDRIAGRAHVPARKNLNIDFPLRGFVNCTCGHPLMGCFSTARNGTRHPYYLCQQKGCASYGKSIRRDVIEAEFIRLLDELRPTPALFAMLHEMMRDLWEGKSASAQANARLLKTELAKLEREESQFLDRIVSTSEPAVISAYEKRIRKIGEDKVLTREKIENCGRPLPDFDHTFRTGMAHLANPGKLWISGNYEDRRAVLKVTFADRLVYARGEWFRTALTSSPFALLSDLRSEEGKMVPRRGLEPPRPCGHWHLKPARLPIPPPGRPVRRPGG